MRNVHLRYVLLSVGIAAMTALLSAQAPTGTPTPAPAGGRAGQGGAARGGGQGGAARGGQPGPAGAGAQTEGRGNSEGGFTGPPSEPAVMLFRETWISERFQPMVQASLNNQQLQLHVYGNVDEVRKTAHPTEDYTYTGETQSNWAITLSDPKSYWNLTLDARIRLKTRNSGGMRVTHVIIKTADGNYFASEEGSPVSSAWIERDYIFRDLTWWNLMMTDTPTNTSNQRDPNPKRVPLIPTTKGTPDLTKVDEVGFSDLTEGGWIPATTRVNAWEVWGKAVPRK